MTVTQPAAVRTSDGSLMFGTTTASLFTNSSFSVTGADGTSCSGTYDAFDTTPQITVPVTCSDGRTGIASVTRTPDGQAGTGQVVLNDGTTAQVAFGRLAGEVAAPRPEITVDSAAEAQMLGLGSVQGSSAIPTTRPTVSVQPAPRVAHASPASREPIRASYTGICDCPYDRMRNGRRCGGNSAYSRPGGRSPVCYR